ncbi:MAG TPA: FAD-dependent oxidoreductase [Ferruginibacter sp.]|nr:FAD-dependent oxidoreductase [Ferruginibacter sp.]
MQQKLSIKLLPSQAANELCIKQAIFDVLPVNQSALSGYCIHKKSIDARGKKVFINISLTAYINEPPQRLSHFKPQFKIPGPDAKKVIIIGAGPAGLFAALKLLEAGIKPIIIERGKDVRNRRRDLAKLNKEGILNTESNYCFGEGGAGTYSDGKLYTRSSKRGDIQRILQLFVHFGAPENILFEAHPHIGTNKLPGIITALRECIITNGGEILFEKKLIDFNTSGNTIISAGTSDGGSILADAFILATGHSARDIFMLLQQKKWLIEAKPFALGVRIEHPQILIDSIQYHCAVRDKYLPPASYSMVQQVNNNGVFSFCMCPGGIIAPASTAQNELVVNGWSPSKRNNPFANSGMVAEVNDNTLMQDKYYKDAVNNNDPLRFMHFQQMLEQKCFKAGSGKFVAPAQRMQDFVQKKISPSLPQNSYLPGVNSSAIHEILPAILSNALSGAFQSFGKKMKGYLTNEAILVATESRTSSPVRIPRNKENLQHPQINNLYPCGEGAGYAGGIVSAAMDGERVAMAIAACI